MKSRKALGSTDDTFDAIIPGTSQKLAFTNVSGQSTAVGANTSIVRLFATEDCFIEFGSDPTAVADTSFLLPAGIVEYFAIQGGNKIAAIRSSTNGNLYITEGG